MKEIYNSHQVCFFANLNNSSIRQSMLNILMIATCLRLNYTVWTYFFNLSNIMSQRKYTNTVPPAQKRRTHADARACESFCKHMVAIQAILSYKGHRLKLIVLRMFCDLIQANTRAPDELCICVNVFPKKWFRIQGISKLVYRVIIIRLTILYLNMVA